MNPTFAGFCLSTTQNIVFNNLIFIVNYGLISFIIIIIVVAMNTFFFLQFLFKKS